MLSDADRLPEPPEILPAPVEPVQEAVSLWRLHWGDEPFSLRRYPTGKFRFDAPAGEYPVTYGNKDRLACFAEVYGDARFIPAAEGERKLSFISALRPLWLIPLDDARFRSRLGLDARITTAKQYAVTRRWSLRFHTWFPHVDGIRYSSRHAGELHNYCLFLDRCATDLQAHLQGEIQNLRDIVLFAAEQYDLTAAVQWRTGAKQGG